MTKITTQQVQHLAQLSSLRLDQSELNELTTDIDTILGYVEQLGELDTENVQPTYQVNHLQNVSRPDDVAAYAVGKEELLALSPDSQDGQVRVSKVL